MAADLDDDDDDEDLEKFLRFTATISMQCMQTKNDTGMHWLPAAVMNTADTQKQSTDQWCSLDVFSMNGQQGVLEVCPTEHSKRTCSWQFENSENSTAENSEQSWDNSDSEDADSGKRIADSSSEYLILHSKTSCN